MGYSRTACFVNTGLLCRVFRKFRGQSTKNYDWIRNQLDKLIRNGRIELTLPKAKELQQYAEELIYHAKRDNHESDLIVESIIRTPECRSLLYEKYVPLYKHRTYFFTRVVNQWKMRFRDHSPMAYLELVDRPNEIRPARPVGVDKLLYIHSLLNNTRRDFRRYFKIGKRLGLIDSDNNIVDIKDITDNAEWYESDDNLKTVDDKHVESEELMKRLERIRKVSKQSENVEEIFDTAYIDPHSCDDADPHDLPHNIVNINSVYRTPKFNP